jgi:F0F1-type ATP synthase membrane subunit c/vacuolar-type H+-ATPase subunit K
MSKTSVTWLFVGAMLAAVVGLVVGLAALVAALVDGAITIGGPDVVTVNGETFAGMVVWLVVASLVIGGGWIAAVAAWVGALFNTVQLEDKTWFIVLLVLGLFSLGWVAMIAYVFAGPDSTRPTEVRRGITPA